MATIHQTTLTPTKLELLAEWLPGRPWYRGGQLPELARAGGFRLDDPAGEVGIEIAAVADTADGTRYLVPMSYRGAPLPGAERALIGTTQHGVLGRRWVYDAAHDPVAVSQLLALVSGRAVAQHQSVSDTLADTVEVAPSLTLAVRRPQPPAVVDGDDRTTIALEPDGLSCVLVRVPGEAGTPGGDVLASVQLRLPDLGPAVVVMIVARGTDGGAPSPAS